MHEYQFKVTNPYEKWRAETMFTKEAGTIAWLRAVVQPGDVVWDVGANVGIYTILAADLVGALGMVFAFEPHAPSLCTLVENVALNEYQDRVKVLASALHADEGFIPFNWTHLKAGTSGHQLGHCYTENGVLFQPAATVLVYGVAADYLVEELVVLPPDVIKIDVDGNELAVLDGMRATLEQHPRTVQVEVHPQNADIIKQVMEKRGFALSLEHHTEIGKRSIAEGADPKAVFRNAIYNRV